MRRIPTAALLVSACLLALATDADAQPDNDSCETSGHGGSQRVELNGKCLTRGTEQSSDSPPSAAARARTVYCGRPVSQANAGLWNAECGAPRVCAQTDSRTGREVPVDVFATFTQIDGKWGPPRLWCAYDPVPGLQPETIRDEAVRLLPGVAIGSTWSAPAITNTETIFWADTSADRPLPTATVAGQRVELRISFRSASWHYGDGTNETTTTPGKPYDDVHDACITAQCAHYSGHVYTHTGHVVVSLSITWHAQYRVGAQWFDIDGDITGPTSRHVLTVMQSRDVLVPNP